MKASNYNIYVPVSNQVICFNTLQETFALLPFSQYEQLIGGKINNLREDILLLLKENGCIVDDDINELELLEKEYDCSVSEKNPVYSLTLLPSLDCNLRCWYCFERHIKGSHMTSLVQENIVKYISGILCQETIQHLDVELFGGEPLLYFEEELYPLLLKIKETAINMGKTTSFFFVTNATCIKRHHIPLFKELEAKFQISIDGYKDKHNEVKFDFKTKEPTYEKVLNIIHDLCNSYEHCYINLRINYDNETLQYIPEVIKDIADIDRRKLGIHLERVWQTKRNENSGDSLKEIIKLILGYGFTVSCMNLFRKSYSCKTSKHCQSIISYDGKVYKCSGRNFTTELQEGILLPNGNIEWDKQKLEKRLNLKTYTNNQCLSCKLLPLCWGPCAQKQIEHPGNIKRFCQLELMEISLEDFVYFAFNNQILRNKIYENK